MHFFLIKNEDQKEKSGSQSDNLFPKALYQCLMRPYYNYEYIAKISMSIATLDVKNYC